MFSGTAPDPFTHWAEVVSRIRGGDEAGVEDLYSALSEGVCTRLFRNVDPQSIEDRLHEILVIVLEAIRGGEVRDPQRLMGFVRTVTRRQVAAHIRSAISERRRFAAIGTREPSAPLDQSPEACTAQQERVTGAKKILRQLNARDREILERFYLREQNTGQICGEMHLTGTQFRLFKSRAIARCSDLIQHKLKPVPLQSTKPFWRA